jgi:chemosensory pili system protein ChpC
MSKKNRQQSFKAVPEPTRSAPAPAPAVVEPDIVPAIQPSAQPEVQADIRGVLIQLAGARLLLPNATIAEVLSYAPPEPVDASPEWLLGKMRWRGWQLPLVAFAELAGFGKEPAGLGSKVVVLKALSGNAKAPYFAILTQGFPRLVTVSQAGLLSDPESTELPLGVQARVQLNEDTAFVPDLVAVESLITQALAQAA